MFRAGQFRVRPAYRLTAVRVAVWQSSRHRVGTLQRGQRGEGNIWKPGERLMESSPCGLAAIDLGEENS